MHIILIYQCHLIKQTSTIFTPFITPPYHHQSITALALKCQKKPPSSHSPLIRIKTSIHQEQKMKTTQQNKKSTPSASFYRQRPTAISIFLLQWKNRLCYYDQSPDLHWPSQPSSTKSTPNTSSSCYQSDQREPNHYTPKPDANSPPKDFYCYVNDTDYKLINREASATTPTQGIGTTPLVWFPMSPSEQSNL
jgi:hypothetical protein